MSQESQGSRRSTPPRPSTEAADDLKIYASQQIEPNKALPGTMSWKRQKGAFQDVPKDFKPSRALRVRQALQVYGPMIFVALAALAFVAWQLLFAHHHPAP